MGRQNCLDIYQSAIISLRKKINKLFRNFFFFIMIPGVPGHMPPLPPNHTTDLYSLIMCQINAVKYSTDGNALNNAQYRHNI